jgi:predicted nuclease of predicted toxin-antitoxin system
MRARFKLDENLPRDAETLLRKAGHDVRTVFDEHLGGTHDPRVFDAARSEDRILVTFDLDFSDIRLYPPDSHRGIWLLRPHTQSIENTLALLRGALVVLETEIARSRASGCGLSNPNASASVSAGRFVRNPALS